MKKLLYFLCFIVFLCSCVRRQANYPYPQALRSIDSISGIDPSRAKAMLDKVRGQYANADEHERMKFALLEERVYGRLEIFDKTDTKLKSLVSYFEENGNPNEQMVAYYLLGDYYCCVTNEIGAADFWMKKAIEVADSTERGFDFSFYALIHSRYSQVLTSACDGRNSLIYAQKAYDIAPPAIKESFCIEIAAAQWNQGQYSKATAYYLRAINYAKGTNKWLLYRYSEEAFNYFLQIKDTSRLKLVLPYLENGKLAKKYGLSGSYNHCMGFYYTLMGNDKKAVDSWEKAYNILPKTSRARCITACELMRTYHRLGQKDKALKYGLLFGDLSEALQEREAHDQMNNMNARYDYSQWVEQANAMKLKNQRLWIVGLVVGISLVSLLSILLLLFLSRERRYSRQLREKDHLLLGKEEHLKNINAKISECEREIAAQEAELDELTQQMKEYEQEVTAAREHKCEVLSATITTDERFRDKTLFSASDWEYLLLHIADISPRFATLLRTKVTNENYKQIAMLLFIGKRVSEIAKIMNLSPQYVNSARSRVYEQLAQTKYTSSEDFAQFINSFKVIEGREGRL